jgi:hypothetical protein
MAARDEVHRLVDVLPEDRVAAIGEVLRAALEAGRTNEQARWLAELLRGRWDSTRLASAPVRASPAQTCCRPNPTLADRVEEILRTESGTAA